MATLDLRLGQGFDGGAVSRAQLRAFSRAGHPAAGHTTAAVVRPARPHAGVAHVALAVRRALIPATGVGPKAAPAVEAFSIPAQLEVVLFAMRPTAGVVSRPARAWLATAAGLPLFLMPLAVQGAPPKLPPTAQPDPTAAAAPADTTVVAAEPQPLPEPRPDPDTAAPVMTAAPSPAQPSKVDAAWDGVVGYDVVVSMNTGAILKGRVSAVHRDTFTMIDFKGGGVVKVYRKSDVDTLRVRVADPLPEKDGTGMLAGGGILATVGTPVLIAGVVFLGIYPSGTFLNVPLLISGGLGVGGGVALLVVGAKRRRAYQEAQRQQRLTYAPVVSRTRQGTWTGGVSLRF